MLLKELRGHSRRVLAVGVNVLSRHIDGECEDHVRISRDVTDTHFILAKWTNLRLMYSNLHKHNEFALIYVRAVIQRHTSRTSQFRNSLLSTNIHAQLEAIVFQRTNTEQFTHNSAGQTLQDKHLFCAAVCKPSCISSLENNGLFMSVSTSAAKHIY